MNYNKNKALIYDVLHELKNHPTAEEVHDVMKTINPKIGIATIYRNLNELLEDGKIVRIQRPYMKDRYDATVEHHYHSECEKCGSVEDVNVDAKINLKDEIDVKSIELKIKHLCKKCQ